MDDSTAVERLTNLLRNQTYSCVTQGYSGVEVYRLPGLRAYLKVGKTGNISDLGRERDILDWLAGKFPVARVMEYGSDGRTEALLISAISGRPGSELVAASDVTAEQAAGFAYAAAKALRRLHDIPVDRCPFEMRLDTRLGRAKKSIEFGLLSETEEEFQAAHGGMSTDEVYADLVQKRPSSEDLVFTHGDPCLPNIMVDGGAISGFIDMDGSGVADRYVDFSIFFRSFRRNCSTGIDLETIFCDAYGLGSLDTWKLDYYRRLDDLF